MTRLNDHTCGGSAEGLWVLGEFIEEANHAE